MACLMVFQSLGVLFYGMVTRQPPFYHDDDDVLFKLIQYRDVHVPSVSVEAQGLIKGLLEKDPSKRLGCRPTLGEEEIKDHPFFKTIVWEDLQNGRV